MSVKTILSDVVKGFEKVFKIGETVAKDVEPLVDTLFPGFATMFNGIVTEAATVEAAAVSANAQSGTGAQKLAAVVSAVSPSIINYAAANGLAAPTATNITNIVNSAVTVLNNLSPLEAAISASVVTAVPVAPTAGTTNPTPVTNASL